MTGEIGVSRATLRHDHEYLRDRMDALIVFGRFHNGYKFEINLNDRVPASHGHPGVGFSGQEIHVLLTISQRIRGHDEGGVRARHLLPMLGRLHGMLGTSEAETTDLMKRVRMISAIKRPMPVKFFELIGSVVIKHQQIQLRYRSRGRKVEGDRKLSPLRLAHFRDTWLVDSRCHQADGLRRFSLNAVEAAGVLERKANDVSAKAVKAKYDGGYGAFGWGQDATGFAALRCRIRRVGVARDLASGPVGRTTRGWQLTVGRSRCPSDRAGAGRYAAGGSFDGGGPKELAEVVSRKVAMAYGRRQYVG